MFVFWVQIQTAVLLLYCTVLSCTTQTCFLATRPRLPRKTTATIVLLPRQPRSSLLCIFLHLTHTAPPQRPTFASPPSWCTGAEGILTGEYVLVPAVTRSMLSSRDLLAAHNTKNQKSNLCHSSSTWDAEARTMTNGEALKDEIHVYLGMCACMHV